MTKYNALAPSNKDIGSFIDNFFNRSINDFVGGDFTNSFPAINVTETNEAFKIDLAAPGLEKADFNIQIEKDHLTITAKKESPTEKEKETYKRREFNYTAFSRTFHLPKNVDTEAISAKYENGILVIHLSKKEVEVKDKVQKIAIS